MPYSDPTNKPWTAEKIRDLLGDHYSEILDVGPGAGAYADLLRSVEDMSFDIDAVEVWAPYITGFKLEEKYRTVYHDDIRHWLRRNQQEVNYDVIIFGDILEHMTKEEAIECWNRARLMTTYVIVSIPIIHYPQGHSHGNPYEEHVKDDWSVTEVLSSFEGIFEYNAFDQTGVFIAGGLKEAAHIINYDMKDAA